MALPTLDKTWQFDVNQELITTGTAAGDAQQIIFAIKNSLIGFASNAWAVISSSDAFSAGAGDKWLAVGDLIWNTDGNPHSWMHLRQTGISANFEVVIDLNYTGGPSCSIIWSPTGFDTAGTTTNRPSSSAGEEFILANSNWLQLNGASSQRFHVMQSTDGECTRLFGFNTWNGRFIFFLGFDKAKNPVPGWAVPAAVYYVYQHDSVICIYDDIYYGNRIGCWGYHDRQMSFYLSAETYQSDPLGQQQTFPNDIDGSYPLSPVGLVSKTHGAWGRHGQVFDLWWGSTAIPMYAGSYPVGTGRQFIHFGNLVFPWNGSVMLRYGG